MRKFLLGFSIAFILISHGLYGQGSWLGATNVVGNGNVIITDMEIDSNGDAYVMGWFDANIVSSVGSITTNGSYDIFLLKINSDGTHAWIRGFGGTFPDLPGGVELGADNSVYISGSANGTVFFDATTSITTTASDAFLANYAPDGTLNWVRIVAGGPRNQRSEAMAIDNDRIIISGFAVDSVIYDALRVGYAGTFAHVSTYDLAGNHLLYNTIGFNDVGLPTSIAVTTDGYALSGYFRDSLKLDIDTLENASTNFDSDIFLYKIDKNLNGQWVRRTTSQFGENVAYSVRSDGADDLYLVGKTGSLDIWIHESDTDSINILRTSGGEEFFIFNYLNSTGNLDWYTIDGSNRSDALWDVQIKSDRLISTGYYQGNYYFGNDTLVNPVSREVFIAEHDLNGNILHARDAFSEPVRDLDQGYRLGINAAGETVISGIYKSEIINFEGTQLINNSPGSSDIFLATYGCLGDGSLSTSSDNSGILCYGDSLGEITVTASGGHTDPHYGHEYDAFIDKDGTVTNVKYSGTLNLTGLPGGTYDIHVYDNANCFIGTSTETITQPAPLELVVDSVQNPWGDPIRDGFIWVDATGGTGLYEYVLIPDSTEINGTGEFYFTELEAGSYTVKVYDENMCMAVIDTVVNYEVGFETRTGLEAKVYPNPTSGVITLEMPYEGPECDMEVINMTGQLVMNRKLYSSGGVINETIDLSDQAKGLYLIRIDGQALQSAIMVK